MKRPHRHDKRQPFKEDGQGEEPKVGHLPRAVSKSETGEKPNEGRPKGEIHHREGHHHGLCKIQLTDGSQSGDAVEMTSLDLQLKVLSFQEPSETTICGGTSKTPTSNIAAYHF